MKNLSSADILAGRLKYEVDRKGVSTDYVASCSGISAGVIRNYLEGKQELNLAEVGTICHAIDVNFFRIISNRYSKPKLHFRNIKETARQHAAKIEECYLLFNDNLPIPQIPDVSIDDSFDDRIGLIGIIQPLIKEIKARHGYTIEEVLDNIRMPIISARVPPDEFDAFLVNVHPYYAIFVNENAPPNRVRFSLAHELSHFLFDREMLVPVDVNTMVNLYAASFTPEERPEFVATKFAQYFLLSFDALQTICSNWNKWLETLNLNRAQKIIDENKVGLDVLLNGIRDMCDIHGITIPYKNVKDHLSSNLKFPTDSAIYTYLQKQKKQIGEFINSNRESYSDSVLDEIFKSLDIPNQ